MNHLFENSKEFLKKEDTKYSNEQEEEKEIRTVFVGNLPNSTSRKEIKRFFGKVGKVESVRIRSLAFLNPSQPRKVSFIKKELHPGRSSFNAYVVFKTVEDARNALRLSNSLLGEKHIRVDLAANKPNDTSKTIFAGGLPFSIEEEEVRKLFNDCGIIDYVRIVRDKKINIGKGFAFVKFMDKGSVDLALRRHGAMYHGRKIRVFRALKTERLNKTKENSFKGLETKKVLLSGAERRIANKKFRIKQKK
ncbi:uncharacterized protein LOC135145256 [Zophobas morio]|uniref:uncharacterized protein LOC135145256 n=1 Tax=Zophobas morio TaxID=2755281 RepID=UPI003082A785